MEKIHLQGVQLEAWVPDENGKFANVPLEYRVDPLLGNSARIITGTKLQPESLPELDSLKARSSFCPFCADTIEEATFDFPSQIVPEGKIARGSAVVVPNILAYSTYSAVGIYDTKRHFLELIDFDEELVGDAFLAMAAHGEAVRSYNHSIEFSSINANYMPSSGSSLVHPHLQSSHDVVPMTSQRIILEASRKYKSDNGVSYLETLVEQELGGPRYVGRSGDVVWVTPFAPSGFHEVWGILVGQGDLVGLSEEHVRGFSDGLSKVLKAFSSKHLSAFNYSLQGGGRSALDFGFELCLKVVSRAPVEPYYRSDVTYFEKLGLEAMLDQAPEEWAQQLRDLF